MFITRVQPTELPFSFDDLKRHCRVDASFVDDDEVLKLYAWGTIRQGEFLTNRIWAQSSFTGQVGARIGHASISIPRSPCVSVESISYQDVDGAKQLIPPDVYTFYPSSLEWDGGRPFALIRPGAGWPDAQAVTIAFTAGWAADAFPKELTQWCFVKISSKYEQREDLASATRKIVISMDRSFADGLLDGYYLPKG